MIMVNLAEAKARLSELVEAVIRGEQVVICKHNRPVTELRPVPAARTTSRDLAPMFPGETFMTEAFFEPMSEVELREWYGRGAGPARVAKARSGYTGGTERSRKRTRRS